MEGMEGEGGLISGPPTAYFGMESKLARLLQ